MNMLQKQEEWEPILRHHMFLLLNSIFYLKIFAVKLQSFYLMT